MTHTVTWMEIPSTDFDRAVDFYSTVLDREISVYTPDSDDGPEGRAGMFQTDDGEVGGMIVETDEFTTESGETVSYAPSADSGIMVYLTVDGDIESALSRAESAGGAVLVPKQSLMEMEGHWAILTDTEGNRVGLMSTE